MFTWWSQASWGAIEIAGIVFLVWGWRDDRLTPLSIAGCLLGVAVLGFGATFVMRNRRGSVVHLRSRRDSRSFLKRNSDTLIVTGIVSLLVVVATFLLTYFFATPKK
jgi:drug/metabolite transporter (DMT)-like permease